ncbi:DUF6286 domain-containing protein [Kitasatospora sp. NPDC049285]|uniref:DUF6286 domain-containing protein n=1 Tax=Kitasatospora sp. NPDC049285 TaxID=3157096 RepID=UPI0034359F68
MTAPPEPVPPEPVRPDEAVEVEGGAPEPEPEPEPKRWSGGRWLRAERGVATAVVVAVVVVAAGALLYDVIAVRAGGHARPWRQDLADQLATRHLDDPWVLGFAAGAVTLGVLLLWLAFARGLRGWLALEPRGTAIHRSAVTALIDRRVRERADVYSWQVRAGRRRTRVTVAGTTDPAGVEQELRAELARIPFAVPYRLDVRTRPVKEHHRHRRDLAELEPPR